MKYLMTILVICMFVGCSSSDTQELASNNEINRLNDSEAGLPEDTIVEEKSMDNTGIIDAGPVDVQFRFGTSHCDWWYFPTIDGLVNDVLCTTIVVAEIISSSEPTTLNISMTDEPYMQNTILTTVEVSSVLKGDVAEGSTITINERVDYCVLEHFRNGDEVILFLNQWPDDPSKPYITIGPFQGNILFTKDQNKSKRDITYDGEHIESIFDECYDMDDVIEAIEEALEP